MSVDCISSGWRSPIQPIGAEDMGEQYDVLEAVEDKPVSRFLHTLKGQLCQEEKTHEPLDYQLWHYRCLGTSF